MVTDSKVINGGDAFNKLLVPCSKQNRNLSENGKEDSNEKKEKKEMSLVNGVRIYKRRKLSQSSSEDLLEHARASPEVGGQLVEKRRKLSQSSSEDVLEHVRVSPEVGGELVDKQQKKEMVLVNGVGNYEQRKLSQSSSEDMIVHAKTSLEVGGQSVNKQPKKEIVLVNGVQNYEQRKLSQSSFDDILEHAKTSPEVGGHSVNQQQKKEMVLVNGVQNYEQRKLSKSSSEDILEHVKTSPEVGGQSVNKQRTKEMVLINGVGIYEQRKLSQSSSGDILEHARTFPEVGVLFVDKQRKLSQASSVDVLEHARTSPEVGGQLLDNQQKLSLSRSEDMQKHARVSPEIGSQLVDEQHKLSQSSPDAMLERARKSLEVGGQVADGQQQLSQSSSKDMLEHARRSPRVLGQSMDKNSAKDHISIVSDVSCDKPNNTDNVHSKKELCQHILDDVLVSEKFSLLGELLSANFQGFKIENSSHFININSRIRDGFYGQSPQVFAEDMQQLWAMLHKIGAEMASLAKGLSDISWKFYHEHVGGSTNGPCVEGKLEFQEINQVYPGYVHRSGLDIAKHYPSQEADRNSKPDQGSCKSRACRYCGGKTDDRICIVCDSCEKMYHVFCVGVSISKDSPRSWYCMNCVGTGFEQPHENCVVCETPCDPTDVSEDKRDSMANGILRNVGMEANAVHQSAKSVSSYSCKLCRCEFVNSHYRECEHSLCHNKFHLRCLSEFELKKFGPRWYCPSCLCRVCLVDRDDEKIVLCDGCDNAYHIYCMEPPLACVPEGKWFCKVCDRRIQAIHKAKNLYENYESHRQKSNEAGSVGIPSSAKRVLQNHKKDRTTSRSVEAKTAVGNMDMLLNAVEIVQ